MTAKELGFTTLQSAVAACLIDGLTQEAAAEAIGVSRTTVHRAETALSARFGSWSRAGLASVLATLDATLPQVTQLRG